MDHSGIFTEEFGEGNQNHKMFYTFAHKMFCAFVERYKSQSQDVFLQPYFFLQHIFLTVLHCFYSVLMASIFPVVNTQRLASPGGIFS